MVVKAANGEDREMNRKVNGIEEALVLLYAFNVSWKTVNRIQNSLWETGVAFFGRDHQRVAYYDEMQNVLSLNQ